jgi:outer membrane protein assembly factor BamB
MGSRAIKLVVVVSAVLGLSACTTNWSTWGFNITRQGHNTAESSINTGNVGSLRQAWATSVGGDVNSAPVVATSVQVQGRSIDVAYLGDEHGGFTAINVADGAVVWHKQFATQTLNCAESPDHIFGTSSTAVVDQAARRVYVAAADGAVRALDLATGNEAARWPVAVTTTPNTEYVEGALTLWQGRVYVPIASHCDITPYTGRVVAIDVAGPTISHIFWVTPEGQDLQGSVWGWGGASVDPQTGDVYVATGNGPHSSEYAGYSDAVVRLTRDLAVVASNQPPLRSFNLNDDFGSTPMLFQRSGCPPQLAVLRKDGVLYVYDRDTIASGPMQLIFVQDWPLLGVAAYDSSTNMLYVATSKNLTSGTYVQGMHAFTVGSDCTLTQAWQTAVPPASTPTTSAPVLANGVVYYGDGAGNTLRAFDAATGAALWNSGGDVTGAIYAAPIVMNGTVLAGAWDGKLHAWRLPSS